MREITQKAEQRGRREVGVNVLRTRTKKVAGKGARRGRRVRGKIALCQAPCCSDCAASLRSSLVRLRRGFLRSVAHLVFSYTSVTSCCKLHRSNRPWEGDQGGVVTWGYKTSELWRARAHQRAAASMDLMLAVCSGLHAEYTRGDIVVCSRWLAAFSLYPPIFVYLTS